MFTCLPLTALVIMFFKTTVFDSVDVDCDGIIQTKHIKSCVRAVGLMPSEKEIDLVIKAMDPAETGNIAMGTFFVHVARMLRDVNEIEDSAKQAFEKLAYVENNEKFLSIQGLQTILLDQSGEPLTAAEADEILSSIPDDIKASGGRTGGDLKFLEFLEFLNGDW